jgi:hypothetical protein
MKNQIALFLATALVASMSFAQSTSTATMPTTESGAKGIRLSLLKPVLKAEMKASFGSESVTVKDDLDEAMGFAVGYASLPVQAFGWTANVAYLEVKNDGTTGGIYRVDGNAAYAFSSLVNVKGGLNLSKLTNTDSSTEFKPAIGLQANVGFQITKNFGVDLGYTQMNQTADEDGLDMKFQMSGFEVGVNGTF